MAHSADGNSTSGSAQRRVQASQWHRLLPFLEWHRELRRPGVAKDDIIAGITVALVLVPQSMAYAQLAGLPAHYGLYASFLPLVVAALFGSSRHMTTGPTAVMSLMTAAALQSLAISDPVGYVTYAIVLAFMVGAIQLGLGILRLGALADFLSHPVVMGFTNAAALIIATSQLGKLFGIATPGSGSHLVKVFRTVGAIPVASHIPTVGMAALALGLMIVLRRVNRKAPGVLVAVAATAVLSWLTGFAEAGGNVVGAIPAGLPGMRLPHLDLGIVVDMAPVALTVALLGFAEAASIGKALAAQTRQRLDPNQELIGQGLANVAASLFQGYPVSGSFARSAVNFAAGARTGFSCVVASCVVVATLLWFTPLLYHLPQATLAAVIIMAVVNLVKIKPIRQAWKVQRRDGLVAVATFVLTLVWAPHLDRGIIVGVLLSLGLHLHRTMRARFSELSLAADGTFRDAATHHLRVCESISLVRFDGSLYFANASYFETQVLDNVAGKPRLQFLILDAEGINQIDATGAEALRELNTRLHAAGVEVLVARVKRQVLGVFKRAELVEALGEEHVFGRCSEAIDHAFSHLEAGEAANCPLRVCQELGE